MNHFTNSKIKQNNKPFKLYKNNRLGDNFTNFWNLSQDLSELITIGKKLITVTLPNKLNDPQSFWKTFQKIFKMFCNGSKIPIIPPIIVNDKLVSDYEEKF